MKFDFGFMRRAVEKVSSWDGAASGYKDTNAFCKACLIDVNLSGTKKQDHCMLPAKAPGSSAYADKAIYAIAGGRGLSAVKKPSDVDQTKWDAAVTKAAKTVVQAYKDLEKTPPTKMLEMAGMARAISVDSIFQQLQAVMYEGIETWDRSELGYLVTVYIEGGELYALFNHEGLLRRALLTLGDNDVVTLGELEDVSQQFTPTQRTQITVSRQIDGDYRLFMLAATALINKDGQIDSTILFDDMVQRAEDYAFWPKVDFAHLGESNEDFDIGQIDWLGRDGICYLATGVLKGDHPLTPFVVRALTEQPEEWGNSIEYYPLPDSVDYLNVGELEIPVFTKGLNTRISILPADHACSWFTMSGLEKREMNNRQREALIKLLGEEEFNKRMKVIEDVNDNAEKKKLVFRTTETETPTETPSETPEDAEPEIVLDDAATAEIAKVVMESAEFSGTISALADKIASILDEFKKFQTNYAALQTTVARTVERLNGLEDEESKVVDAVRADLPRKFKDNKMRMTYRPRQAHAEEVDEDDEDYAAIAAQSLKGIPSIPGYN